MCLRDPSLIPGDLQTRCCISLMLFAHADPDEPTAASPRLPPGWLAQLPLGPQSTTRSRREVTHHGIVREMLLSHLDRQDLQRMGELWEKAIPRSVEGDT